MTRLAGDPAGAAATACCPRSPAAKDKVRGGNATQLLFPANRSSLDYLDPGLVRELVAGDTIPDRPPGTAWYVVAEADAPRTLVLHSTTHVPPSWRQAFGAAIDWTWTFRLTRLPAAGHGCTCGSAGGPRLAGSPPPISAPSSRPTTSWRWACCIMAMGMLRGLKKRAERAQAGGLSEGWRGPGGRAARRARCRSLARRRCR